MATQGGGRKGRGKRKKRREGTKKRKEKREDRKRRHVVGIDAQLQIFSSGEKDLTRKQQTNRPRRRTINPMARVGEPETGLGFGASSGGHFGRLW